MGQNRLIPPIRPMSAFHPIATGIATYDRIKEFEPLVYIWLSMPRGGVKPFFQPRVLRSVGEDKSQSWWALGLHKRADLTALPTLGAMLALGSTIESSVED